MIQKSSRVKSRRYGWLPIIILFGFIIIPFSQAFERFVILPALAFISEMSRVKICPPPKFYSPGGAILNSTISSFAAKHWDKRRTFSSFLLLMTRSYS